MTDAALPRQELAQLNIARLADLVSNLERINALAEASPGFVWHLQDEAGSRLKRLREKRPTAEAFTFKKIIAALGA
jgi:hypothetical protein